MFAVSGRSVRERDIGAVVIREKLDQRANCRVTLYAQQAPPIAAISLGFLADAVKGELPGIGIESGRVSVNLGNGRWVYALGEYNAEADGFVMRMVEGEPFSPERPSPAS